MIEPIVYWTITILSLVLPMLALILIARARGTTGLKWWLRVLMGVLLMAFCYQACVWAIYSIYLKYVFPILTLGVIVWAWIARGPKRVVRLAWRVFGFTTIALLFVGNGLLLRGHMPPRTQRVEMQFPLRHGTYYIIQGGNSRISNFFHGHSYGQRLALDIVKLNSSGMRARGILPKTLDRYVIYGDTIYSPCNGVVITAADGRPESVPPSMRADHPLGNGVVLKTPDGLIVILAHMKPGSVLVAEGQQVRAGEPLGQVGNSGRSAEPHLHIAMVRPVDAEHFWRGEPIAMTFDGRFLTLNDVVKKPPSSQTHSP